MRDTLLPSDTNAHTSAHAMPHGARKRTGGLPDMGWQTKQHGRRNKKLFKQGMRDTKRAISIHKMLMSPFRKK